MSVKTYEGMLLVEPTVANREWERIVEEVERVAKRHGAAVLQVTKWGERKLAYPIRKVNRGTYVLTYLAAPPKAVAKIREDFRLSEVILRSLILRHEGELRKEPPKDFETAGPVPPKTDLGGGRPGAPARPAPEGRPS